LLAASAVLCLYHAAASVLPGAAVCNSKPVPDVRDAHRTWQRYADGLNSVVAVGKELLERVFIDG